MVCSHIEKLKTVHRSALKLDYLFKNILKMDFLGDIVEKEVEVPKDVVESPVNGFPELYQPKKVSNWKQRLMEKRLKRNGAERSNENAKREKDTPLSEAERIHLENIKLLQNMSLEEFEMEKRELLDSLNPQVLKSLISRVDKRMGELGANVEKSGKKAVPQYVELEGPDRWIGGTHEVKDLPRLDDSAVNEALGITTLTDSGKEDDNDTSENGEKDSEGDDDVPEQFNDEDDMAPQEYQFVQSIDHMSNKDLMQDVHFIRSSKRGHLPMENYEAIDINDPKFNEKLYDKYFPDLPQEPDKLQWMDSLPDENKKIDEVIHDVSMIRFDFKGNLVPFTRSSDTTNDGLHHHAERPELAGYTIPELAHLSFSKFASQRCIAIQTLGRILYKLGKQKYYELIPEVDVATYQEEGGSKPIVDKIYYMFWDLMKDSKVIDSLQLASDASKTSNLSVQNYAVDALWLWKQGGGDKRNVSKDKK